MTHVVAFCFCPLDGDHPLRVLHRLLPHMKGVIDRERNRSKSMLVKRPHVALPPNEILHSEELKGSTRTYRNSLKKNVVDGKKGRRMHKIATA